MLRELIVLVAAIAAANAMKCYQCQATVGDCIDGQCTGGWCAAIITEDKTAGTRKVEKTCAQANPASSGVDGCSKEVSGTTTTQKCGCQIEDFCNSEAGLTRLLNDKLSNGGGVVGTSNRTGPQPGVGANIPNGSAGGPVIINNNNPNGGNGNLGQNGAGQQQPQPFPNNNGQQPNNQPQPGGPQPGGPQPGGPQPLPGGPQNPGPNPNLPPQQGGPPNGGQEFNNGTNSNPQLPRFPPPGSPNNGQPELGQNPNNPNNGQPNNNVNVVNGQRQPGPIQSGNGVAPVSEPEPTPKNGTWPSTTLNPNAINGQQQALDDNVPRGSAYTCVCSGPTYCEKSKCKGDLCSTIEIAREDLARSPGAGPGQAPVSSTPIVHMGCMGNSPGASTSKISKLPYTFIMEGKKITVNANEKFCTGDLCNSSAIAKMSAIVLMFSFVSLLLLR